MPAPSTGSAPNSVRVISISATCSIWALVSPAAAVAAGFGTAMRISAFILMTSPTDQFIAKALLRGGPNEQIRCNSRFQRFDKDLVILPLYLKCRAARGRLRHRLVIFKDRQMIQRGYDALGERNSGIRDRLVRKLQPEQRNKAYI